MYLLGILTREYSPDSKHLKTKKINRQVVNTKRESFLPLAFFMRPSMKPKSFNDEPAGDRVCASRAPLAAGLSLDCSWVGC